MLITYTLGQLRLELARGVGPQAPWFERMRGPIAQEFQATCYQLLEELQAYIRDHDPHRPRRIGQRYAEQAHAAGLGLEDLLRAFLHFGGYLLESVFRMVELGGGAGALARGLSGHPRFLQRNVAGDGGGISGARAMGSGRRPSGNRLSGLLIGAGAAPRGRRARDGLAHPPGS
jgi:hypothetical protein